MATADVKRWFVIAINIILAVFFIGPFVDKLLIDAPQITRCEFWGVSEFLVNYQGGFVRRGLLGQLIYWFCMATGVSPRAVIFAVCIVAFVFVAGFVVCNFRRYGIRWWIYAPILCVMLPSLVRKDFLIITLYILSLRIYTSKLRASYKYLLILALSVVMLLTYEPSFFMCLILMPVVMWTDPDRPFTRTLTAIYVLVMVACMALMLKATGNQLTPLLIHRSWVPMLPAEQTGTIGLTLDSMRWTIMDSLQYNESVLLPCSWESRAARVLMLIVPAYTYIRYPYYVVTTRRPQMPCPMDVFASLFVFLLLCQTPLLLGLSCDYGRIVMQVLLVSFATAVILGRSAAHALPQWWTGMVAGVNRQLGRIPCNIYSITILTLVFVAPYSREFTFAYPFVRSVCGRLVKWLSFMVQVLYTHIF